jgi:hypothetical protein
MTRNTNCLQGIRCPECRNDSSFYISTLVTAEVTDDGAAAAGDMEWDGESPILCSDCEHSGTVTEFHVRERRFTTEDADRLLQLGDQFLSDWAEDAVRGSERDPDYEERVSKWNEIRPLLATAPHLRDALEIIAGDREACTCQSRSWYGTGHDTQCPRRIAADALAKATTN